MTTQEASISELIDHGSISFGRFSVESLAWEKWSVFSHNRCQEEIEKFKAPGLVAQKKAYFEEYYKRIRAIKKLQAEQQEKNQSDLCRDEDSVTLQVENSVDITKSKDEKNNNEASLIKNFEADTVTYHDLSGKTTQAKSAATEQRNKNDMDNVSVRVEINMSSSTPEPEDSANKYSQNSTSSIQTHSTASQQVSSMVKLNANKLKDCTSLLKSKGTVASAKNKTKFKSRGDRDADKPCEKQKQIIHKATGGKTNKDLGLHERTTLKAARNLKLDNVSSCRNPIQGRSSATLLYTSVVRDKPASSSASAKGGLAKINLNVQGFMHKRNLKQSTVSGGMNNVGPGKRTSAGVSGKVLESNIHLMIPKRGQSENQKPKLMSTNLPVWNKSNQNRHNEFRLMGKQRKEVSAAPGRVPIANSATLSGSHKFPNPRVEHQKILPWQSPDLTHAPREPRHWMPGWR